MTTFFWTKYPFVRVGFALLLGIFLAYLQIDLPDYTLLPQAMYILHLSIILVGASIWYTYLCAPKRRGVWIMILFCCLGYIRFLLEDPRTGIGHLNQSPPEPIEHLQGRIITEAEVKRNKTSFVVSIDYRLNNGRWLKSNGRIKVYTKDRETYDLGQTLYLTGALARIKPPDTAFDFDYAQYMAYQKIYHALYTNRKPIILNTETDDVMLLIKRKAIDYRNQMESIIKKNIADQKHQGLLIGLLTGTRSNLSAEDKALFTESGTIHILAISGMHIVLIYQVLLYLFLRLNIKDQNVYLNLFIFGLIWFYIFITGLQASTVRAGIMISIVLFGKMTHKSHQPVNSLFATAFIMLVYNPYYIADLGFCLSFLAIIGILLVSEITFTQSGISLYLLKSTAISTAAQLTTLPYTLFLFQQAPVYFLLANIILVPLSTCLLLGGIALLCVHGIPYLSDFLIAALNGLCQGLFKTLNAINSLPFHLLDHLSLTALEVLLCYMLFTVILVAIYSRKKNWLWASSFICLVLTISVQTRIIRAYHTKAMLLCGVNEQREYCIIHHTNAYLFQKDTSLPAHFATEKFLSEHMVKTVTKIPLPSDPHMYITNGHKTLFLCEEKPLQTLRRGQKTNCCIIDYKNKYSYITLDKADPRDSICSDGKKTMYIKELSL
jgi:competence protein ComEC